MEVDKRNSHSEIEKRRRDKMNQYINDLATMVPVPPSVARKPDKLTVLRLTVQHMKALQGSSELLKETNHRPSFLSDDDLRNLITEASGGFLIVVECERGQVLYVTDSVKEVLNISQSDMVRSNFYDLVHAKDTAKIKTQLSTTTTAANSKKGEHADINTSPLIVKSEENAGVLCPGAKRSFLCRMKKGANVDKAEAPFEMSEVAKAGARKTKPSVLLDEKNHILTSFKGFLRAWPPNPEAAKSNNESSSCCCLVAVVRAINVHNEHTDYSQAGQKYEFEARYRDNGVIVSVDNSFTTILGYCPDEVVGKSTYSFIHKDDLNDIADAHHYALNKNGFQQEVTYRLRAKAGHYVPLRTTLIVFRNPWSKNIDYIISKNVLMTPIFSSLLLISDKRMMEKQTASQEILSDDGDSYVFRESIRDLLRKLEELDSSESKDGKSRRKRTAGTLTTSKTGEASGRSHTPDDIGVLIAEQAKKLGQENKINAHSGQYSNVALTQDSDVQAAVNDDLLTSSRAVHPPMSDLNRLHGDNTIGSSTRMQNNFADTILSEQLAGIQDAIQAMENTGTGSDDDDKLALLVNVIENDEELGSVLDDMPWNFI